MFFKKWFKKEKKQEKAQRILKEFHEQQALIKKEKEKIEEDLLIGILSFRQRTCELDHYRKEIEELLLPIEENIKWEDEQK